MNVEEEEEVAPMSHVNLPTYFIHSHTHHLFLGHSLNIHSLYFIPDRAKNVV
jgi:hypothetical protein